MKRPHEQRRSQTKSFRSSFQKLVTDLHLWPIDIVSSGRHVNILHLPTSRFDLEGKTAEKVTRTKMIVAQKNRFALNHSNPLIYPDWITRYMTLRATETLDARLTRSAKSTLC